ncbi:MAG TPA: ABC transporter permease [Steroidobacteraceae bacterium]|nr:ABC transporter permease [Steroidobacteraceae bacterium]
MNAFTQIRTVVAMNLRCLPQRVASSAVVVVGIAGVVAVLISVMSLSRGLANTLASTGRADRAIVLGSGPGTEVGSTLPRGAALTILDAAQVMHDAAGKPIGSAEVLVSGTVTRRDRNVSGTIAFRGLSHEARRLRPEVKLVAGRWFRSGVRELVAGRAAQARFKGLEIGDRVRFGNDEWVVVGAFASGGDARESELLADAETLMSAYHRTAFNAVTVQLTSADDFDAFKSALTSNPTLSVNVQREPDYYVRQSGRFASLLSVVATVVGAVMAIGAVFAALNTMYTSVSSRTREIATLRALGYGSAAVVASVLTEALLLALAGALLGAAIAWLIFNGNTVSTLSGGGGLAQVVFQLRISVELVGLGMAWACGVGFLGGLLPALRAARIPVATALRAV